MTLNLTKSPALFRTLGAGAALLATSFFDLWTVNSGFGLLAMPGPGNFWEFLGSISAALHWRGQALPSVLQGSRRSLPSPVPRSRSWIPWRRSSTRRLPPRRPLGARVEMGKDDHHLPRFKYALRAIAVSIGRHRAQACGLATETM